jgi:hypothetical protein
MSRVANASPTTPLEHAIIPHQWRGRCACKGGTRILFHEVRRAGVQHTREEFGGSHSGITACSLAQKVRFILDS